MFNRMDPYTDGAHG